MRAVDLPVKATVAMIALSQCFETIRNFSIALAPPIAVEYIAGPSAG